MVNELRAEFAVLLDRRMVRWSVGLWVVASLLTSWEAAQRDVPIVEIIFWGEAVLRPIVTIGPLIVFALGGFLYGSAFRDQTIRWRVAESSHRLAMLTSKLAASLVLALVIAVASVVVGLLTLALARRDGDVFAGVDGSQASWLMFLAVYGALAFSIMGTALSGVLKSDVATLFVCMVWVVGIERLFTGNVLRDLLPYAAAGSVLQPNPGQPRLWYAAVLAGWAALLVVGAAIRISRTDL